jgi:hypothetical protein
MAVPQSVVRAYADIQAILANNNLTDAQKQDQVKQRRAQAAGDQFTFNFNNGGKTVNLTDGDGVNWTIGATGLAFDPSSSLLELFGVTILRNGVDLHVDPHQQFVNPPLLFNDPSGTIDLGVNRGKFRVDPAAVLLTTLIDNAKSLL